MKNEKKYEERKLEKGAGGKFQLHDSFPNGVGKNENQELFGGISITQILLPLERLGRDFCCVFPMSTGPPGWTYHTGMIQTRCGIQSQDGRKLIQNQYQQSIYNYN